MSSHNYSRSYASQSYTFATQLELLFNRGLWVQSFCLRTLASHLELLFSWGLWVHFCLRIDFIVWTCLLFCSCVGLLFSMANTFPLTHKKNCSYRKDNLCLTPYLIKLHFAIKFVKEIKHISLDKEFNMFIPWRASSWVQHLVLSYPWLQESLHRLSWWSTCLGCLSNHNCG